MPITATVKAEMKKATQEALIELIARHNPYTKGKVDEMLFFIGNPDPTNTAANNFSQIEMEIDSSYPMTTEWSFKGNPQKINKVLRIKYRYPFKDSDGNVPEPMHWVTAFLLVGFEDGSA